MSTRGAVVVREDVLHHCRLRVYEREAIDVTFPASVEVRFEALADEAGVFLDLAYEMRFVDEVEMADGDEFFKAVGEEFTADVEATDGRVDRSAA